MLPPDELDEQTRLEFARKLKTLKSTKEAVEKKLNEVSGDNGANDLLEYQELIKDLRVYWQRIPFVDRKRLATAFLAGVVLQESAPHFIMVDIVWKTPSWEIDSALIWRSNGASPSWTEEENAILREHYPTADRETLLSLLPNRTWRAIFHQATRVLELPYVEKPNNTPIQRSISYQDYVYMQEQGLEYSAVWGSKMVFWSA